MLDTYAVILADPPWRFQPWSRATGLGRSPEQHYPTMTIDDLCALPVRRLAASNCALFLWCTWPLIFEAPRVFESWGFSYRTLAWEWVKLNPRAEGLKIGLGFYTRANVEPCLLAVRGSMPVQTKKERNVILAPAEAHSRKPDEQYAKIERLYPEGRRIELFARRPRPGWACWGNNVAESIDLEAYR